MFAIFFTFSHADEPSPVQIPETLVQTQAKAPEKSSYLDNYFSLSKMNTELQQIPMTVALIPEPISTDRGATSLQQALDVLAGVRLRDFEKLAGDVLMIRGIQSADDLFLDGLRDFGHYHRDPFFLEKIEIFKGPVSTIFGRGSGGGIVNQVSKAPELERGLAFNLTGGSDRLVRGTADVNSALPAVGENTFARLNLLAHEEESQRKNGLALALGFGLGTASRSHLSFLKQNNTDTPAGIGFAKMTTDILTYSSDRDINADFQFHQQLRYSQYHQDNLTSTLDENALDYNLSWNRRIQTPRIEHKLVFALEGIRQSHSGTDPAHSETTLAASVADTMKLSPQWEWTEQLRYDYMESLVRIENQLLSSRGGLVWNFLPEASAYLTYATSFNPSPIVNHEPEKNRIYELGTKCLVLQNQLRLSAALFNNEKIGFQRVHGFEIEAAGSPELRWELIAGFTSSDLPQNEVSIWSLYQFAADVTAGFGAKTIENSSLLNAMARYRASANTAFRLNINNLDDRKYDDIIHLGLVVPGPERTFALAGEFSF